MEPVLSEATANQNHAERKAYLAKQIKAAKSRGDIGTNFIVIGLLIVMVLGFGALAYYLIVIGLLAVSVIGGDIGGIGAGVAEARANFVFLLAPIILFGFVSIVCGYLAQRHYAGQLYSLEKEYSRLGGSNLGFQSWFNEHQRGLTAALRKPRCPNCGNEIPEGNIEFCSFCGKSLKRRSIGPA
jgi:hypothetical protein